MVPTAWVKLGELPRLPNGKLDRQALPAPVERIAEKPNSELPRTETEKKLAAIWAEVLKMPKIVRTDDLLLLGADSIHVFQITARANKSGLQLAAKDLFKYRTLAALAEFLDQRTSGSSENDLAKGTLITGKIPGFDEHSVQGSGPRFSEPRRPFHPSRSVKQATN
jgi:aryl carrier-like protein